MFGLTGREARFALVISSTHFGQHVLIRLIPPLIPVLAVTFAYPLWQLGALLSVFYLGSGLSQAPLGVLADRYDRLYLLPIGIALGASGYLLFAVAPVLGSVVPSVPIQGYRFDGGFIVMCASMLVVGVGTAVVHPVGYPMITTNVSDRNKGKVLGAFGSSSKLGDAAAPASVGAMLLVLAWDRILLLFGLLGLVFGIGLYVVLRADEFDTSPSGPRSGSTAEPVSASTERERGVGRRSFLYPMGAIYLFFVTKMFAGQGVNTFMPAFVVAVYAYSFHVVGVYLPPDSVANFYFAALLLFAAATQLLLGGVADRYDPRTVLLCFVGVATLGLLGLSFLHLSAVGLLLVMLVLAAGLWGVNPARDALISDITPAEREGRTFGYLWTTVQLTGAAIPILIGYVMEAMGMRGGFVVLAAGTVLAGVSISLLYSNRVYVPRTDSGGTASR